MALRDDSPLEESVPIDDKTAWARFASSKAVGRAVDELEKLMDGLPNPLADGYDGGKHLGLQIANIKETQATLILMAKALREGVPFGRVVRHAGGLQATQCAAP